MKNQFRSKIRIKQAMKRLLVSLFKLFKSVSFTLWQALILVAQIRIRELENYVDNLYAYSIGGKAKKLILSSRSLESEIANDLDVRNSHWGKANILYHAANWEGAKTCLLQADAIQDSARKKMGFSDSTLRYIGTNITGSIGHIAISLGLRSRVRILENLANDFLIVTPKSANDAFLDLWRDYFPILRVSRPDSIAIERNFWPLFEHVQTVKTEGGVSDLISAHNKYARAFEEAGLPPLLNIPSKMEEMGKKKLREWGWDPNGWFVVLHVRENKFDKPGYGRNANPNSYIPAIKAIVELGGTVVRIGDRGMSALPEIIGFVDLTNRQHHEEWLDIFLMAKCKIFIGTTSGPLLVPSLFGKPVLATNAPDLGKFVYLPKSLVIPKRVKTAKGKLLTIKEQLSSPAGFSDAWLPSNKIENLQWVANSPDDILNATTELLTSSNTDLSKIQQRVFEHIILAGASDSTPISMSFLESHPEFIQDINS